MSDAKVGRRILSMLVVAGLLFAVSSPSLIAAPAKQVVRRYDEKAVADFYRGRYLTIVVGFAPGGGYDITSRLIAKHIGKHLPGHPNVIVMNRPGAGSLVTANLVYNTLRKDGTFIADFHPAMLLQQAQGREGLQFDGRKYNWLGSVSSSETACGVHKDTGVTHVKQIMGPTGRVVTVGAEAPGSGITDGAAVMRAALGLKFRMIYGYAGQRPVMNALLNREVDVMCTSWQSFTSRMKHFFEPVRLLNMLVINAPSVPGHPWLKNAVAAQAIAPNEKARQLLRIVDAPRRLTYPYAVAPGVPADRVAALRNAFDKTLADPAFITDFTKTRTSLVPRSGEEVTEIVKEILLIDNETVAAIKETLERKEGP